jgi:hypothetical protein
MLQPAVSMRSFRALRVVVPALLGPLLLSLPGCYPDVTLKQALDDEQEKVQRVLADRHPEAKVDVHATTDGRQIEVIFPEAPDRLADMNIFSPPDTARGLARTVGRKVKAAYDGFEKVQEVKVGFTGDASWWTASVKLGKEDLRTLDP